MTRYAGLKSWMVQTDMPYKIVSVRRVQRHTGVTHYFLIFDIRALWCSGLSPRVPECQKLKMTSMAKCKALMVSVVKGLTAYKEHWCSSV